MAPRPAPSSCPCPCPCRPPGLSPSPPPLNVALAPEDQPAPETLGRRSASASSRVGPPRALPVPCPASAPRLLVQLLDGASPGPFFGRPLGCLLGPPPGAGGGGASAS